MRGAFPSLSLLPPSSPTTKYRHAILLLHLFSHLPQKPTLALYPTTKYLQWLLAHCCALCCHTGLLTILHTIGVHLLMSMCLLIALPTSLWESDTIGVRKHRWPTLGRCFNSPTHTAISRLPATQNETSHPTAPLPNSPKQPNTPQSSHLPTTLD